MANAGWTRMSIFHRLTILVMATLAGAPAVSCAAGNTPTPLDYAPTGDRLWDAYAVRLLLNFADPANPNPSQAQPLPADWLDELGASFAADPRYAQLRCWEAGLRAWPPGPQEIASLETESKRHGGDAASQWLILNWQAGVLDILAEPGRESAALDPLRQRVIGFRLDEAQLQQQYAAALDRFVTAYPAYSCGWYARAIFRLDREEFDAARADLARGNTAASSELPIAFPASFVLAHSRDSVDVLFPASGPESGLPSEPSPMGSEVAGGLVLGLNSQRYTWWTVSALPVIHLGNPDHRVGALLAVPTQRDLIVYHKALAHIALMPGCDWSTRQDAAIADSRLLSEVAQQLRKTLSDEDYRAVIASAFSAEASIGGFGQYAAWDSLAPYPYASSEPLRTLPTALLRELAAEGLDTEQIARYTLTPLNPDLSLTPSPHAEESELQPELASFANAMAFSPGVRWDLRVHGAAVRLRLAQYIRQRQLVAEEAINTFAIMQQLADDHFASLDRALSE